MMTVHVLHAGDGYTYLTRQVASGDHQPLRGQALSEYYLAGGNPPGRWVGTRPPHAAVSDPELGPLGSGRAGAPWLFPGARPGAHQRAGYLGTSLNEQLGLQIRPGRGAALRPSRRTGRRSTGRTARAEERFHLRLGHSPVDVALRYLESFASTGGQA